MVSEGIIDYKIYAFVGAALIAIYLAVRIFEQIAANKIVRAEIEQVLTSDEHKAKGRFG